MKQVATVALIFAVFVFFVANIFGISLVWDSMDFKERDSQAYIEKSVNGNTETIVYGETQNAENGSANIVSAIVVDYRGFDTLGEVTILFVSSLGVAFIFEESKKRIGFKTQSNFILKTGSKLVFGFILIFGVYMFTHGHLTPGGGFPGGALIAAAFLMLYLSDEEFLVKNKSLKILEGAVGTAFILLGGAGLLIGGYFLQNIFPTGTIGELISGGFIPIIYIIIGLKVGSELTGIFDHFMKDEVEA